MKGIESLMINEFTFNLIERKLGRGNERIKRRVFNNLVSFLKPRGLGLYFNDTSHFLVLSYIDI